MLKFHRMQDYTFPELREVMKNCKTIIIPHGLSEQHGAHLPLDVDIRNADYMSARLAEGLDCLIAPTLNYSFSGGMMPGTINCKPNTVSNLIGEIIESLHSMGFLNFIILPGHGGSESVFNLKESMRILKWVNPALKDAMIIVTDLIEFSPTSNKLIAEHDYHAADAETSMMMAWYPEVVRKDKIKLDEPEVAERLRQDPDSYQYQEKFSDLPQEIVQTSQRTDVKIGVMGYPMRACAETGRRIEKEFLENAVPALKAAIAQADAKRQQMK
ncbi:MAG: creatininase family protein [Oligosphaeraceae bacterium]|nr:creatininase family protein [Oligosphaeraceae bacterium]